MNYPKVPDYLKERRDHLKKEYQRDRGKSIGMRLKENGIKSLFVVPIIHDLLGFKDLRGYGFEVKMGNAQGLADILLAPVPRQGLDRSDTEHQNDSLLIETKEFGWLRSQPKPEFGLPDEYIQISEYIRPEGKPEQAILTDGAIWFLFLKTNYIQRVANKGMSVQKFVEKAIVLALEFDITSDFFWEYLLIFHENYYRANLEILSKAVVQQVEPALGAGIKLSKMFDKTIEDPGRRGNAGDDIRKQIAERFAPKKGEMKETPGEKFRFDDGSLQLTFEVTKDGFLKVDVGSIIMNAQTKDKYPKIDDFISDLKKDPKPRLYPSVGELFKGLKDAMHKQEKKLWQHIKPIE